MGNRGVLRALAALVFVAACDGPPAPRTWDSGLTLITIAGSTASLPFVTRAANAYMETHPGVAIQVEPGGSRKGLARVSAGEVHIGTSDFFATGSMSDQLEDHKVAVVGFAAMANRGSFNERIPSLTKEQLRGVFSGQLRDWSELGGEHQPIVVINRASGSGTRVAFGSLVLGGDHFVQGSVEQDGSSQVQAMLLGITGAISYLALPYARADLSVFKVDGVAATNENIASGAYPIWAYEHMYTRGPATGEIQRFLAFVLSVRTQEDVVARAGFLPVLAMRVIREHD